MELTLKTHCCLCNSMLFRNNSVYAMSPLWSMIGCAPLSLQGRGGAGCKTMDGPGSPRNGPRNPEDSKIVTTRPKFQKMPRTTMRKPIKGQLAPWATRCTQVLPRSCLLEGKGPELLVQILTVYTPALPPEPLGPGFHQETGGWPLISSASPHLFPWLLPYSYSLALLAPSLLVDLMEESWVHLYPSHTRPSG